MIKVFTKNDNGKIEFTPDELKALLDEAYYEGRNSVKTYTWTSPITWQPYTWYSTTAAQTDLNITTPTTITLSSNTPVETSGYAEVTYDDKQHHK